MDRRHSAVRQLYETLPRGPRQGVTTVGEVLRLLGSSRATLRRVALDGRRDEVAQRLSQFSVDATVNITLEPLDRHGWALWIEGPEI